MRITITRDITLPDAVKLERFRHSPHLGPHILFFSGGTALRALSADITRYTHNSIHLITPFDSGGSSATLRKTFNIPAVGDIRNRLMALADQTIQGNPEMFELFSYRLPRNAVQDSLLDELATIAYGEHPLVVHVPDPLRAIVRNHLHQFIKMMPDDFDLRGASIGNLVLAAGYLANRRHLDPVIYIFSKMVQVLGTVRPIVNSNAHLCVRLQDGRIICGQHRFTGKSEAPVTAPISDIWLAANEHDPSPVSVSIREKTRDLICSAELVCYPMGSFFSSVMANLLPRGVGRAVAANHCPKVFVPNTGHDPELTGHDTGSQVRMLLDQLKRDDSAITDTDVLNFILLDTACPRFSGETALEARGIRILRVPLTAAADGPIDPERLNPILLSLC